MMKLKTCGSNDHTIARRQFLGQCAAGGIASAGLDWFTSPLSARSLENQQKRVLVVNLAGGLSQLESWDPKPGTVTGGPFRAIPTSVPGIHISELLPVTAKQMHHLAIIRGVNTSEDDHGKGAYMMMTGRKQSPAADYPMIGAVMAKGLTRADDPLPGHIVITPGGGGGRGADSAYLGPKYSSVILGNGNPPQYSIKPGNIDESAMQEREQFRRTLSDQFAQRRRSAMTDTYTYSYEQALQLMAKREIFDVSKEPAKDLDRYGKYDFGRHCLLARRLLEKGLTYVQVTHTNYDTHNENFDFHLEQLGEFDRSFGTLVSDLAERGLLEHTLIVVLSEFGRTPNINHFYGRDHWSRAWSVVVGGAGIKRGCVVGKTNPTGTEVVDRQVTHGDLFHTYLQAVGLDSTGNFQIDGRPTPMADPAAAPINEALA